MNKLLKNPYLHGFLALINAVFVVNDLRARNYGWAIISFLIVLLCLFNVWNFRRER